MRGRKPTPTHLRVVTGNPSGRPLNPNEPKAKASIPKPPKVLDEIAKEEWARLSEKLFRMGILTEIDMAGLAAYCQAYSTWHKAQEELNISTLTINTSNGNIIQNPLVGIRNKAALDMVKFAAEFGMTPSARSRITAAEQQDDDPAESYFG